MTTKGIMPKMRSVTCAVLACIVIGACASSGGGGNGGTPQPGPQPQPPSSPHASKGTYWDTLLSGTVGEPERASFSAEPGPGQTVRTEVLNPTLDPGYDYTSGNGFPVLSSSLKASSTGLSAVSPNHGATVSFSTSESKTTATLSIPQLNLDAQLYWTPSEKLTDVLSYVVLGVWAESSSNSDSYRSITAFAFGYETPHDLMPKSGTATFSGDAGATVLKPVDGHIVAAYVRGTANFSVDFGSGGVGGALTNMKQSDVVSGGVGPIPQPPLTGSIIGGNQGSIAWNDVSVTASIAGGTNRFSGNTAATSAPNTTFSLAGSATGHIDGAFYGPSAENLGAVWSLSDGTASALGTVGAGR